MDIFNKKDGKIMVNKDIILEMLNIQENLDKEFIKYIGENKITLNNVLMALFDELGELNHEMKHAWCYWKKSQKDINVNDLKEELSDVWHFAISLHIMLNGKIFDLDKFCFILNESENNSWFDIIIYMLQNYKDVIYYTCILTEKLGFSVNEMYKAYLDKNVKIHKRMKEGY